MASSSQKTPLPESKTTLTKNRLDVLTSFLSPKEGTYTLTVTENKEINIGTTVLYLERAMTEDCQTFNASLDKLYKPELTGDKQQTHLELLRSLKMINDICFDNFVKYLTLEKMALIHFFGSLGPAMTSADLLLLKNTAKEMISTTIKEISEEDEKKENKIRTQYAERLIFEKTVTPQIGWRKICDLPLSQLTPAPITQASSTLSGLFGLATRSRPTLFMYSLASDTQKSAEYLLNLYETDPLNYHKICSLRPYIRNFKNGVEPGFSVDSMLAMNLNEQETLNLQTGYPQISARNLTVTEVRALTEEERIIIAVSGTPEIIEIAFARLQKYRSERLTSSPTASTPTP